MKAWALALAAALAGMGAAAEAVTLMSGFQVKYQSATLFASNGEAAGSINFGVNLGLSSEAALPTAIVYRGGTALEVDGILDPAIVFQTFGLSQFTDQFFAFTFNPITGEVLAGLVSGMAPNGSYSFSAGSGIDFIERAIGLRYEAASVSFRAGFFAYEVPLPASASLSLLALTGLLGWRRATI